MNSGKHRRRHVQATIRESLVVTSFSFYATIRESVVVTSFSFYATIRESVIAASFSFYAKIWESTVVLVFMLQWEKVKSHGTERAAEINFFFYSNMNIYNISYSNYTYSFYCTNTTGTIPWGARNNDYPMANTKRHATLN